MEYEGRIVAFLCDFGFGPTDQTDASMNTDGQMFIKFSLQLLLQLPQRVMVQLGIRHVFNRFKCDPFRPRLKMTNETGSWQHDSQEGPIA